MINELLKNNIISYNDLKLLLKHYKSEENLIDDIKDYLGEYFFDILKEYD